MKEKLAWIKPYLSWLFFAIPILVGGFLLYLSAINRKEPEKIPDRELARTLRVIEVQPITVIPRAIGFGESEAASSFQAIAEVKGKITELHRDLKSGSFIREGELLVAIDTTDIEITIQKLEAEIDRSEASVQELKANEENLKSAIAIEKSSLQLANRELERLRNLSGRNGAISTAEIDTQQRSVLGQQQSVQNLQNSLNLLPAQIKSAEASTAVSRANLVASQRDLERCRIMAPFDCRIGAVELEVNEVVAVGQQLLTAQSIEKIEVEAQFGIDKVANLIRHRVDRPSFTNDLAANPQELIRDFFALDVTLRYGSDENRISRDAKFERLREQLDDQARTIGIIVSIDLPYQREVDANAVGPPPVPGTYCEVELRGKPLEESFIVPRAAIRQAAVFLVDNENRLRKKTIEVKLVQQNFASITGLQPGDRIVVSDPTPAIEGMLVLPQLDHQLATSLRKEAQRGSSELKD